MSDMLLVSARVCLALNEHMRRMAAGIAVTDHLQCIIPVLMCTILPLML